MNETVVNFLLFVVAVVVILLVVFLNKEKKESSLTTIGQSINHISDTPISEIDLYFTNLINFLKSDDVFFRYGKNKVEKDYQQDLEHKLALLTERFGYNVIYEAKEGKHRIDFTIDDVIGIEMKIFRGGSQVEKELFYQITKYGELYPKIVGFVLNATEKDNKEIQNEIEEALRKQNVLKKTDYEIIVKSIGYNLR